MPVQMILNAAFGIIAFLLGWWMKTVWSDIRKLKSEQASSMGRMSTLEVLIAGEYIKKHEFEHRMEKLYEKISKVEHLEVMIANHYVMKTDFLNSMETLFKKLDRIEEKLDKKADKL